MPRVLKATAVLILTLSLGLHWAVLQSVAWAGMVVSFSRTESIASAIGKTFDGKHACKLCRLVQDGRSAETAPSTPVKPPKLEASMPVEVVSVMQGVTCVLLEDPCLPVARSRTAAPPTPPPRLA